MSTYLLFIELEKTIEIQVGKLGWFCFPTGQYLYVGRAKKNVDARLARHRRKEKILHWHIDYVLQYGKITSIKMFEGNDECGLASFISNQPGVTLPALKFGSSDCSCKSHFFLLNGCAHDLDIPNNLSNDP